MTSETMISIRLAKTVPPSYVAIEIVPAFNSLLRFWIKTGPFWNTRPATMKVAPVSESDLAKARENAAINEGLMIGKVTVLEAVSGGAPRVRDARSYSIL